MKLVVKIRKSVKLELLGDNYTIRKSPHSILQTSYFTKDISNISDVNTQEKIIDKLGLFDTRRNDIIIHIENNETVVEEIIDNYNSIKTYLSVYLLDDSPMNTKMVFTGISIYNGIVNEDNIYRDYNFTDKFVILNRNLRENLDDYNYIKEEFIDDFFEKCDSVKIGRDCIIGENSKRNRTYLAKFESFKKLM